MAFFRDLGRQFKATGQLIGEGARTLTSSFKKFVGGIGDRTREALPYSGASLAPGQTPQPLAPPRPTASGGTTFYDPTSGKELAFGKAPTVQEITTKQQGQYTTPETRTIQAVSPTTMGGGLMPPSPLPTTLPKQPQLPSSFYAPLAKPLPTPAASTFGTGGGLPQTTRRGVTGRVPSTIAGQVNVSPFLTEEEEEGRVITPEEQAEVMRKGQAFSEAQAREFGIPPTQAPQQPTFQQGIGDVNLQTTMPSASIQNGMLKIPAITDAQGLLDQAAQQAAAETSAKLAIPGFKFTAQDLDSLYQVKKQEALDKLQTTDPELYNNIVSQLPQAPTDEELIATLPPEMKDNASSILNQTPTEILDDMFQQYGITDLLAQMNSMRANIVSEIEAYDIMIADIKNDPDFPRKLADRRANSISDIRDKSVGAMQAQLQFLSDQYNQSLNLVKMGLGFYQDERQFQQQELKNNRDQLNTLINTGGLIGFDDTQLGELAAGTGYTLEGLKSIQTEISKKQKEYTNIISQVDDAGTLSIIGIKSDGTPELVGAFSGVGKTRDAGVDIGIADGGITDRVIELNNKGFTEVEVVAQVQKDFKITQSLAEQAVKDAGVFKKEFISKEWIKEMYRDEAGLDDAVEEAGFDKLFQGKKKERENFLESMMQNVNTLRKTGLSDSEILKQLQD